MFLNSLGGHRNIVNFGHFLVFEIILILMFCSQSYKRVFGGNLGFPLS